MGDGYGGCWALAVQLLLMWSLGVLHMLVIVDLLRYDNFVVCYTEAVGCSHRSGNISSWNGAKPSTVVATCLVLKLPIWVFQRGVKCFGVCISFPGMGV